MIHAGGGNDTDRRRLGAADIYGGSGSDLIFDGGAGTIHADGNGDNVDTIYGSGQDDIIAGQGNDIIYNQGGTDSVSGGGPGTQVYVVPAGSIALPTPSIPTPTDWPPPHRTRRRRCPRGADGLGRWGELAGSDSGGRSQRQPGPGSRIERRRRRSGQFVAWSDSRSGQYEIYVAEHTASGWQQLAGSARAAASATRPARCGGPALP